MALRPSGMTPGILVASDKWKGSLTSAEVGALVAAGLHRTIPGVPVTVIPVADGGDGSVAAALAAGFEPRTIRVEVPYSRAFDHVTAWRGAEVVVEVAQLSRRDLPLDPLGRSSHALGAAIRTVIGMGAGRVVVALGGSLSTDGGAGLLEALGARLLGDDGAPVRASGGTLARLASVDLTPLERWTGVEIVAACDIEDVLLGERGSARLYGPQKGASPEQVELLEAGLAHWRRLTQAAGGPDLAATPGSGASGGNGYGLLLLGARAVSGAELFLDLIGFDGALEGISAVVTGEGRLDTQSLAGKLPTVVARRSAPRQVAAIVGSSALSAAEAAGAGIAEVLTLASIADPARAMSDPEYTARAIERLAADLGRRLR